ncbi:ParB N-terminal domain-containing protein [Ochrobactrum sp. MR28]|nr:ParB N-terminal domain-containing protein [Ochrobactrum sp. MR28]MBX8816693.1 ParB N-terminal domain-containing protein [Ochrobactrum sp. MR31]
MSNESLQLHIDEILVPSERLRPINEEAAQSLALLIKEQGQLSPIAVYRSNAAARPYTLIYGARRLRAMQILGQEKIEVVLRNKDDARMLEITDNLNVAGLSQLESAEFLSAFRECWEEKNGKISRGGNRKSNNRKDHLILPNYFNDIKSIFGFSTPVAVKLQRIADHLHPELKRIFKGTAIADEQGVLLKLAKKPPLEQRQIAIGYRDTGDLKKTLKIVYPEKGRMDEQTRNLTNFMDAWRRMNEATKQEALKCTGLVRAPMPRESLLSLVDQEASNELPFAYQDIADRDAMPQIEREFDKQYRKFRYEEHMAELRAEQRARNAAVMSEGSAKKAPAKRRTKTASGKFMGRPRKALEMRLHEWFIPKLAERLLSLKVTVADNELFEKCRELSSEDQDTVASWFYGADPINTGHKRAIELAEMRKQEKLRSSLQEA